MSSPGDTTKESIRGLSTVVADFAGVTAARVATLGLGLLTVVLTARVLPPAGYAVIAYMTLGATLVLFLASGWSAAAVTRYGREELERDGGMGRTAWARVVLTAPMVALLSVILVALAAAGVLPEEFTWTHVWLTVLLGGLFVAGEQLQVVMDAAGRMRRSAFAGALRQAVLVAGLLAVLLSGVGQSTLGVAWLMVAVAALLMVGLAVSLRGLRVWPPRLDRAQLRRVFVFSLPLIAFTASQYGIRSVDIVVLRAYRPPADVGVYALAYQSCMMLQSLTVTITIVLIPLFVSLREAGRDELIERYHERHIPQSILAAAAIGGLAAPLAVLAVPIVFGADFEDAARPLALLIGALFLSAVASMFAPILMLNERTRETGLISAVAFVANVILDIVLIGVLDLGIIGPAIATNVAMAVIVLGYQHVARRDLPTGPRLSPLLALPLVAGILPPVLMTPAVGVPLGLLGAAATTALVLRGVALFEPHDADVLAGLDLPPAVRRRAVAIILRLAR